MNHFDDESNIIEHLQLSKPSYAVFPENDEIAKHVLLSLMNDKDQHSWRNTSGKSDPPPDYVCNELNIMMEVMRVDDHTRIGKKGTPINHINALESKLQRELDQLFPGIPKFINAVSDLKGLDDHNYRFYVDGFHRIVGQHINHIPLYRKNHSDKILVFYVFDESSAYMEAKNKEDASKGIRINQPVLGRKHIYPQDKNFLDIFKDSDVDYLIWHTPFKRYFRTIETKQLPQVCVINLKTMNWERLIDYNVDHMMSVEE